MHKPRLDIIFLKRYLKSLIIGYIIKKKFREVTTYCMFIGYQRSGHSYIGAILDAHPNIVMAMEADALNLLQKGYNRNQLFYSLLNNSVYFTNRLKNIWTGYSYAVPDAYQGTYKHIKVIGDKKGGKSTLRLGNDGTLIDRLKDIVKCKIKILHVIRNPFDNITTMTRRQSKGDSAFDMDLLSTKIDLYFRKAEINNNLINSRKYEILEIYHEKFIENPFESFKRILNFIEVGATDEFIRKCTAITYKTPHYSRLEINWPKDLKEDVQKKINRYPFLKRYTFESK